MKKILLVAAAVFCTQLAYSQADTPKIKALPQEGKGIVYNKEFTVDFKIHTSGFGLGANWGKLKTYYRTRFFNLELVEIKHPKEIRQSFDFRIPSSGRISRSFIFGKQNNLYVLHGGIGEKRYFSEKAINRGLAVGISYSGGPMLGLLKPYHLDLIRFQEQDPTKFFISSEPFLDENADKFLDLNSIYGASGFTRGFDQISIAPGAHAKFAIHLDWGAYDEFVKSVEAGVMVDVFFKTIPIMVSSPLLPDTGNQAVFVNLFVNLQLGKRR
jgi:hypothetical protein